MSFPTFFHKGDSLDFEVQGSEFPPTDGWSLAYQLVGPSTISIGSAVSGDSFVVSVSAGTTSGYAVGLYSLLAIYTNSDGRRSTVDLNQTEILPDPATASATDARSHAQIVLDAIEAVLEKRATTDQASYSIGNRSLSRMPVVDLLKFRNHYRDEVLREQGRKRNGRKVLPRFCR